MAAALALIGNFVCGALWRRWLGGWLNGKRWWRFVAMPVLAWPLWLVFPWWVAIIITALCGVFFAIGHKVERPWYRYGPFGVAYWAALKFWRNEWNRPPLIDGAMAVGELLLGGLFWATVALLLFTTSAHAQDRDAVRQWIHDQKTEHPIYYYQAGTNCCSEADGKQRVVEYLGGDNYKTYDDDGTPLYFNQDALGVKDDSPFYQWFVFIVNHRVLCARRPQTGG